MRVRRSSGPSLTAALLVASLGVAAVSLGAAGKDAPLADAAQRGDTAAVLSLLEQQVDVNAAQGDGATALHWAVYLNDADTTAFLIRAGANVDAPNNYGVTPLMLAARSGQVDAVTVLLRVGADINVQETWNGQSALMWAAAEGHVPVVQTLIEHGADIGARSNSGATPLLFAARKGSMHAVRTLLAAGSDVNETRPDGATSLLVALINGHEDLVDLLLEHGADPNVEGGSTRLTVQGVRARPMPLEVRKLGYSERESEGVARGNIFGKPLQAVVHVANWHISDQFIVVNLDRLRVIRSLLAHGADVNGRNTMEEPRWSGARYRRHLTGATAFLFAAKVADVDVMRLLLDHGADPTMNTEDNITPLMAAAGIAWASNQERASEAQVLEAVTLLVEELGADVNFVSDLGETAMHAAAGDPVLRAVLRQYCTACHNQRAKVGGLALDTLDMAHVGENADVWEQVVRKLRTGAMPPAGRPRPDTAVSAEVVTWLETELDRAALEHPNPGRPTLHRLNRSEYRNAVRDLLALDIDASLLPADNAAYGFDNNADALTLSSALTERYLGAAAKISQMALGRPRGSPTPETIFVPTDRDQGTRVSDELPFGSRGGTAFRYYFPADQVLAFQADITRVTSFMMARENIDRSYTEIGLPEAHHSMSHHGNNPDKMKDFSKLNTYHVETLAYYLNKLQSIPDGDGTLLDHTVILYGSGMSDGNIHNNYNVPVVVIGGRENGLRGNRHLSYPKGTPLANLSLNLLDKFGVYVETFGDSTGHLPLLSGV